MAKSTTMKKTTPGLRRERISVPVTDPRVMAILQRMDQPQMVQSMDVMPYREPSQFQRQMPYMPMAPEGEFSRGPMSEEELLFLQKLQSQQVPPRQTYPDYLGD